jgi:RNA polymerase-associated protein RTF1
MLARKSLLRAGELNTAQITMERSRLTQALTLAQRRQDQDDVQKLQVELANLAPAAMHIEDRSSHTDLTDVLAKVNERNRKANLEAVRKAEMMEIERKRRERKLAASGLLQPLDPSARLKTVPRLFNSATPSRFVFTLVPSVSGPSLSLQPTGNSQSRWDPLVTGSAG